MLPVLPQQQTFSKVATAHDVMVAVTKQGWCGGGALVESHFYRRSLPPAAAVHTARAPASSSSSSPPRALHEHPHRCVKSQSPPREGGYGEVGSPRAVYPPMSFVFSDYLYFIHQCVKRPFPLADLSARIASP